MENQYANLSAESEIDALARMTPEECQQFEQWLDSQRTEDEMLDVSYESRTDIGE